MAQQVDVAEILDRENRDQRALKVLLDQAVERPNRLFVQKTMMGTTDSYVASVSLEWVSQRLRYAHQLPLFRQSVDPTTGGITIDQSTIDEVQQRPLDWSRQAVLAQYLALRKAHKFPPLLAVFTRAWVDDPKSDEWGRDKRAVKSVTDYIQLDSEGRVGLLDVSDHVWLFALDGQHRLMGIQGLMDLIKTGKLEKYNKDKKPTGTSLTVDDLDVKPSHLQTLAEERVGIELIPAVVVGETREEAKRRVRSVFVHVNRMAVHLTPGQVKMLDEDDGFSIVARRAAVSHSLFQPSHGHQRVNWKSSTIAANATVFTTLQTLAEMATRYLEHKYPDWKYTKAGLIPQRPDDDQLEEALQFLLELFDKLKGMPSIATLDTDSDTGKMRRFKKEGKGGVGHMLYRPIGQIALAQALGVLVFVKKMSIDNLFAKLKKLEKSGTFSLESPQSPFYLVLYDPSKQRILMSGRDLAARLLQYMLGGMQSGDDVKSLRRDFAESRHLGSGRYRDLDGKTVKGTATIALPPVA